MQQSLWLTWRKIRSPWLYTESKLITYLLINMHRLIYTSSLHQASIDKLLKYFQSDNGVK